jgi:hypothetical protein
LPKKSFGLFRPFWGIYFLLSQKILQGIFDCLKTEPPPTIQSAAVLNMFRYHFRLDMHCQE